MAEPVSLVTGGAGGLLGGFGQYRAAQAQNDALARAGERARNNAIQAQRDSARQAGAELVAQRARTRAVQGLIATSGEASGLAVGAGGSTDALLRQNAIDASRARNRTLGNLANANRSVGSQFNAQIESLVSRAQSPLVAAFSGAAGGFAAGQGIGVAADSLFKALGTPTGGNPFTVPDEARIGLNQQGAEGFAPPPITDRITSGRYLPNADSVPTESTDGGYG